MKRTLLSVVVLAMSLVFAAPAAADPDTAFADELHTYGIYGQKDYNAWIGKIMCKRIYTNVDPDVFASADFVRNQLHKDATTAQAYQFVAAGLRTYCPEKLSILDAASHPTSS